MTSRALEAAMQADWDLTREPYDPPRVADADPWYRDDLRKKIAAIIRAFGQNLSEEAAIEQADVAARHCKDNPDKRFVVSWLVGFYAAIEKDLE